MVHDRRAVPGNGLTYQLDGQLGYLMTTPDPSAPHPLRLRTA
jgi:hypothetical protein